LKTLVVVINRYFLYENLLIFDKMLLLWLLSFFLFSQLFDFNYASTLTWNGGSGYWNDPLKWSSSSVPSPIDDVIVYITNTEIIIIPSTVSA
jgi:hypothetical protein